MRRLVAALVALLLFTGVDAQAPRTADGFRNNYPHPGRQSFWAWKWQQLRDGLPQPPPGGWNLPAIRTDPEVLRAPGNNPTATWIGHATVLVRLAGRTVLFDPIFSEHASPIPFAGPRRIVPLPIDIPELPKIDVVLISHNHYDHLDEASVLRLAAMPQGSPRFLVPLGLKAWFTARGIARVDEYDWWQSTTEGPLTITMVPAQHWSRRTLNDTNESLWGGWVVEGEGLRLIHTGDTGYSKDFRDIGERFGGFDMAFIPIGTVPRAGSCRQCMWTGPRRWSAVPTSGPRARSASIGSPRSGRQTARRAPGATGARARRTRSRAGSVRRAENGETRMLR